MKYPMQHGLYRKFFSLLVPGGTFLVAEPMFVVSGAEFKKTLAMAASGQVPHDWLSFYFSEVYSAVQKGRIR
jgi:hypothetical protein